MNGRVRLAVWPSNFTELTVVIKIADSTRFEKVRLYGNKESHRELDEDKLENPKVYFTFVVSSDKDPQDVIESERTKHEWKRKEGNKLDLELSELA